MDIMNILGHDGSGNIWPKAPREPILVTYGGEMPDNSGENPPPLKLETITNRRGWTYPLVGWAEAVASDIAAGLY